MTETTLAFTSDSGFFTRYKILLGAAVSFGISLVSAANSEAKMRYPVLFFCIGIGVILIATVRLRWGHQIFIEGSDLIVKGKDGHVKKTVPFAAIAKIQIKKDTLVFFSKENERRPILIVAGESFTEKTFNDLSKAIRTFVPQEKIR
jgi:hypothetical protein